MVHANGLDVDLWSTCLRCHRGLFVLPVQSVRSDQSQQFDLNPQPLAAVAGCHRLGNRRAPMSLEQLVVHRRSDLTLTAQVRGVHTVGQFQNVNVARGFAHLGDCAP